MREVVNMELIERSTARVGSETFCSQVVSIIREEDTVKTGIDGHVSRATHPTKIVWEDGCLESLENVTSLILKDEDNRVVAEGDLNFHIGRPKEDLGGVHFYILEGD